MRRCFVTFVTFFCNLFCHNVWTILMCYNPCSRIYLLFWSKPMSPFVSMNGCRNWHSSHDGCPFKVFYFPPSQIKTPLTFWFQSLYENTLVVFKTTLVTMWHVFHLRGWAACFRRSWQRVFFVVVVVVPKRWDVSNKILLLALQHLSERDTGKRRRSALCLQAKGVMFNFWNEAIENQLTLQRGALKFRGVKLAFVLFSLVWIFFFGQHSANKVKRMNSPHHHHDTLPPPLFWILPKKRVTKTLSFSNDWIQMNSQCNRKCVQFKVPGAEWEK